MGLEEFKAKVKAALAAADITEVFVKGHPMPEGGFAVEDQPTGEQYTIVIAALE